MKNTIILRSPPINLNIQMDSEEIIDNWNFNCRFRQVLSNLYLWIDYFFVMIWSDQINVSQKVRLVREIDLGWIVKIDQVLFEKLFSHIISWFFPIFKLVFIEVENISFLSLFSTQQTVYLHSFLFPSKWI